VTWLWALTPAWVKRWAAGIAAALAFVWTVYVMGRKSSQDEREEKDKRDYDEKTDEIEKLDLGLGATDLERIERLRAINHRAGGGSDRR